MRFFIFILNAQLFIGVPSWAEKPIYSSSAANNPGVNSGASLTSGADVNTIEAVVTGGTGNELYYIGGAVAAAGILAVLFSNQGKSKGASPAVDAVDTSRGADTRKALNNLNEWGNGETPENTKNNLVLASSSRAPTLSSFPDNAERDNTDKPNDFRNNVILVSSNRGQAPSSEPNQRIGVLNIPQGINLQRRSQHGLGGLYTPEYIPEVRGRPTNMPPRPLHENPNNIVRPTEQNQGNPFIDSLVQRCIALDEDIRRRNGPERGGTPGLESHGGMSRSYTGFQWKGTIQPDNSITSDGLPAPVIEGRVLGSFDECMKQGFTSRIR